jgi:hypothetical protein
MSNTNPDDSKVFWSFDKAVEYFSTLADQSLKEANIPLAIRTKVSITGHIDTGIKIHSTWEDGDDVGVIKETASAIAGVVAGAAGLAVATTLGATVAVAVVASVAVGHLVSTNLNELYDKQIDGSLGKEASAFLGGFSNTILNTLLDNNTTHANFAESDLQTLQTQINPEKENSTSQDNSDKKAPVFPITPDKETPIFLDSFEKGILDGLLGLTDTLDGILDELEDLLGELEDSLDKAIDYISIDPLAFDLDGDGIQTSSLDNHINFDHNNNGVKTNTAWLSGNDAWLTLDKNKNGVIDNGAELFGDNTIKQDGTTAKDGIDALKDLDNNQDGIINNQDIQFANLKLWQDTNQDGVSQQTELKTLSELGIKSIDLTRTGKNQQLTDAIQSDGLTFTKTDGTLGEVAELDLNQNEFLKAA